MPELKDGKCKCTVCGQQFPLQIGGHYISRDDGKTGMVTLFKDDESHLYDTFDCPNCGCQNVVQNRKRRYNEPVLIGEEVEEQTEIDGQCTFEEQEEEYAET